MTEAQPPLINDQLARRNAFILSGAQAVYGINQTILITLGGLIGMLLADNKALATLPISMIMIGVMISTIPASLLMKRIGRRAGFLIGVLCGMACGMLGSYAIYIESFELFCVAMLFGGTYQAFSQYYRFAAADVASDQFKSKAISWVMIGGVVAAIVGPELVKITKDLASPVPFAGAIIATAIVNIIGLVLVSLLKLPKPHEEPAQTGGRPLVEIMTQPMFIVAVLSGTIGYAVMSLIMTASPLAVVNCGYTVNDAAFIIQWHALAMFAPGFFTGNLINRFGVLNIIRLGTLILMGCVAMALVGVELHNFWLALVLLGIGWNFTFIGGTTLLTGTYTPEERNKAQAANDFLVFSATAAASYTSGTLLHLFGWEMVNIVALPGVVLVFIATSWLAIRSPKLGRTG